MTDHLLLAVVALVAAAAGGAVTVTGPSPVDPIVIVALVSSVAAIGVAFINARVTRSMKAVDANAKVLETLRADAALVVDRAEQRAQQIAEQAATDIIHLRAESKEAHERADRAEQRSEEASERLIQLEAKFHMLARKSTILEIWSIRVSQEMRDHGLTPPPLPE